MADGDANDLRLICSLCKIYVKNVEEYGWHLRDVHTSLTDRNKKESEPKFTIVVNFSFIIFYPWA